MKLLEGKVAIVTGAGRPKGMGRASALKLAEQGASVVVTDVARERKDLEIEGLLGIGDDGRVDLGLERAGAEAVDGHARFGQFRRQSPRQPQDGALAGAVADALLEPDER